MTTQTCSVEGCGAKRLARGYCANHYYRLKRQGSLQTLRERGLLAEQNTCSVEGCGEQAVAGGRASDGPFLCHTHSVKLKRSGTLKRLVFGKKWRAAQSVAHRTPLSFVDDTPDPRPGHRGFLAVNTVSEIRSKAMKRGKKWSLEPEEAFKLITAPCHYCGAPANWPEGRNGIDRADNRKHYTTENTVSCCYSCNSAKGSRTQEEFRAWLQRASTHYASRKAKA
jgi:hypothetical protein